MEKERFKDMTKDGQGYIIIATHRQLYVDLALNLALSIKLKDKRPVALMHNDLVSIPDSYKPFFDWVIRMKEEDIFIGTENKIYLFKYSPFQETMFIDGDCLLMKKGINFIWKKLDEHHFTVYGHKVTEGTYGRSWLRNGGVDINHIIKKFNIPYVVSCNGGLIYFDKSETAAKAFRVFNELHKAAREGSLPDIELMDREPGQYAEEILLQITMGMLRLEPFPIIVNSLFRNYQWFCAAQYALDYKMDVMKGICRYRFKGASHYESPIIAHFCRLRPHKVHTEIYIREANKLRQHFGLAPMDKDCFEARTAAG